MAIQVDGDRGDRCHADYRLKRGAEGAVDPADMAVLFFAALAARSAVCASVEGLVHSDRFPLSWSWAGGSSQQLWPGADSPDHACSGFVMLAVRVLTCSDASAPRR